MKTLLESLERNVELELSVQLGIQEQLDQQLDILVRGRSEKLAAVLANAESGLQESRRLEAERVGLLTELAAALGVPREELTLKTIEEKVGAAAASLADKGAELKKIVERIRDMNRQVGLLLRHSVLFIEDLVQIATGGTRGAATYTRAGNLQSRAAGAIAAQA